MQGIRNKKEILELIDIYKLDVLCFQETKWATYNSFALPNFNMIRRDGSVNSTPHGGVAVSSHTGIPYEEIQLNSPIQAIAVRVRLHTAATICNPYSPRSEELSNKLLEDLFTATTSTCHNYGRF